MDLQQALSLIDHALSILQGTRQDHINLQMAMETVRKELNKNEIKKNKDKHEPNPDVLPKEEIWQTRKSL